MSYQVFMLWTGDNSMSPNRRNSIISSQQKIEVPIRIIDDETLQNEILREIGIQLHPTYYCLNLAHRADYLRALLMHFLGGGYSDIKLNSTSWLTSFGELTSSSVHTAVGYREVSAAGVANVYSSSVTLHDNKIKKFKNYLKYKTMRRKYRKLIGCGAFIFKPNSEFTSQWWFELNHRLDFLYDSLMANPCQLDPKERPGKIYSGTVSKYPVPWTYLLGDIFHPLCLKYSSSILQTLPPPSFDDYE